MIGSQGNAVAKKLFTLIKLYQHRDGIKSAEQLLRET